MNTKSVILRNVALMVVFGAVALTTFSANVRTVQVLGLLGCGAVIGAALKSIILALRSKQPAE